MEDEENFNDENNFSVISNDDMHDISSYTDYSLSAVETSSLTSPSNFRRNTYHYSDYNNIKMQQSFNNMMPDMHPAANMDKKEEFRLYIDQLAAYMFKHDQDSLRYLEEKIYKYNNGEVDMNQIGRTTPLLYPDMHSLAKLNFPGLIYQLIPNTLSMTGGIITINDELYSKVYDQYSDQYPGPLTPDRTTEDQVRDYLKDHMTIELEESSINDIDNAHLLLRYMELLIKEDGKPIISNVVKLLNEGVETRTFDLRKAQRPHESISRNSYSRASSRAVSRAVSPERRHATDPDLPNNGLDFPPGPGSVASVMSRAVHAVSSDLKLYNNMDKYRKYILLGKFEDAVSFAMEARIWDHAFALALRMNNPALVNEILVRFSRRAVYANDPLYTMHELMAAKTPMIVATNRAFTNTEMNDWRSHLSMILVVRKYRPEESRQAIESMGDKLMLLRSYFAAHLCFLLSGTSFGVDKSAQKYRRKFDLIGWPSSTTHIPAQKSTYALCHRLYSGLAYWNSAPEQYVKLTEVYEYVLRLRSDDSHRAVSVHLLPYKYTMTFRMLSRHRVRTAYEYCRDIGHTLGYRDVDWLYTESVTFTMVANVRDLGYKLHSLLTNDDDKDEAVTDESWLQNIDRVYCGFCAKYKLWDPRSMRPDVLIVQMMRDTDEETDSLTESRACPQTAFVEEPPLEHRRDTTLPAPQPVPMAQYVVTQPVTQSSHTTDRVVATSSRLVQPVPTRPTTEAPPPLPSTSPRTAEFPVGLGQTGVSPPDDSHFTHRYPRLDHNQKSQSSAFMPLVSTDLRASNETVDCFSIMPESGRSRHQSNGSVARSRHTSQNQEVTPDYSNRHLYTTKEEPEQLNHDVTAGHDDKKPGWNMLGWLKPKQKGVYLPDDSQKDLEYDPVRKKWIDRTNPDSDKPPTPPPKMPMSPPNMAPSLYQGPTPQSGLSRYRQATPNVKPSSNISTPLPPHGVPNNFGAKIPSFVDGAHLYSRSNHIVSANQDHSSGH